MWVGNFFSETGSASDQTEFKFYISKEYNDLEYFILHSCLISQRLTVNRPFDLKFCHYTMLLRQYVQY